MNEPRQQPHQRWHRGYHPERKTGSREWEGLARTRERTHQRVRRGRSLCMESSSCRLGQARQHKRPGWMLLGASTIPLMCLDPRRSHLMHKTSRRIRGSPLRRRGIRSRGRPRAGRERGQGAVKEEPAWLDGGRYGGCSGGPGPSQLGPGIKRSRAGSWTLDGRQQVLVYLIFVTWFQC